ncbi:MAG TPA: DNA polymerase III subunit beta [Mariprofundaceae bacterium]|nr:DNA polymerase III subunit beta [Mariprofundaceae bacterium]
MRITVSKPSIVQAVQRCQSVVEKRNTVPILSNVLLQAADNALTITATDLEVGIRTRIPATVHADGATTVSARKLFDIVKELDAESDVELAVDEGFLNIQSGRAKFRLSILAPEDFPDLKLDGDGITIHVPGHELADMIAATSFAMSQDETRQYLTGTLFEVDADHILRLVATDGHRLAMSETRLEASSGTSQCIVPRKAVMEIRRIAEESEEPIALSLGERQIRLESGVHHLTSKLIDARFPVYRDVIPQDNPDTVVCSRSQLDQVLRRSMIVANEFTHDVRITFSQNGIQASAHNTEQEQAEEFVEAEHTGKDVTIGFNAKYLRDALGSMKDDRVRLQIRDELSPVLMREAGSEKTCHVIMPMRI